jgi:hypothetical protein
MAWLARHPRFVFRFTPTSASWNAVEGFFAKLTRRRLKRGIFKSIVDLQTAIHRFIAETNGNPKPLVWTKHPDTILGVVKRGKQTLEHGILCNRRAAALAPASIAMAEVQDRRRNKQQEAPAREGTRPTAGSARARRV